uniref:DUF4283 domain-containing protein n=1 Tax=Ananas comosus var. bracteatus TaxID=296719 RepID=A0A6V7Q037_ANACO|nr:unnamed protein product [Ananas comosus var. bracteatus]
MLFSRPPLTQQAPSLPLSIRAPFALLLYLPSEREGALGVWRQITRFVSVENCFGAPGVTSLVIPPATTAQQQCRNAILANVIGTTNLGHFPQDMIASDFANQFGGFFNDFHVARYRKTDYVIFLPQWVYSRDLVRRRIIYLSHYKLRVSSIVNGFERYLKADNNSLNVLDLICFRCQVAVEDPVDIPENLSLTIGDLIVSVEVQLESTAPFGGDDRCIPFAGGNPNKGGDQTDPLGQQNGQTGRHLSPPNPEEAPVVPSTDGVMVPPDYLIDFLTGVQISMPSVGSSQRPQAESSQRSLEQLGNHKLVIKSCDKAQMVLGARSEEVAPRTISLLTFFTGDASLAPRNVSILSSSLGDATPAPSLATPRKSNCLAKKEIEPALVRAIARKVVLKKGADAFPQRVYSDNQPIKACTLTCRKIKRKMGNAV